MKPTMQKDTIVVYNHNYIPRKRFSFSILMSKGYILENGYAGGDNHGVTRFDD